MFASVEPSAATVRRTVAFKSSSPFPRAARNEEEDTRLGILFFVWYTGRDSNPQPSEPESDALSIEPPVHA